MFNVSAPTQDKRVLPLGDNIRFAYPKSRQFPFDQAGDNIVYELELRNWDVPGIKVEFYNGGSGEAKYRMVGKIIGGDFIIGFGFAHHKPDLETGVREITIPRMQISVYEDESGPSFYYYVGDNYERDKETFMYGAKFHSKMRNMPRVYLRYKGGCDCMQRNGASFGAHELLDAIISGGGASLANLYHRHDGKRPPLLIPDSDCNREYEPIDDEPVIFRTDEVMDKFVEYLNNTVLTYIQSFPIPDEIIDIFVPEEAIPMPDGLDQFYATCNYNDAMRIIQGKHDPLNLKPDDRHGSIRDGLRLVPLSVKNDGTIPEVAYDGFIWTMAGTSIKEDGINLIDIPDHYFSNYGDKFLVCIMPNRANGIYVADQAAYEKCRKKVWEIADKEGRDRITDEELNSCIIARGRTIVPLSEYRGGYKKPIVLINRELSLDEVNIISQVAR